MNASKENARKAMEVFDRVAQAGINGPDAKDIQFVLSFFDAAEKKLPTEASYTREKGKKKSKVK